MSHAVRLFFASGLSLLAGAGLGAYVTSAVHGGEVRAVDPAPREKACAPCPACPACPPPAECGGGSDGAATTTLTSTAPARTRPRPTFFPQEGLEPAHRPGLPASVIQLASARVQEGTRACLEDAARSGARGILLLDLTVTVTATAGEGLISEAGVRARSSDAKNTAAAEACVVDAAKRTRFGVIAPDGEARFQLPILVRTD